MNAALGRAIEAAVREATGREVEIADSTPVGGGCINHAEILLLADGGRLFAKSNASAPPEMFEREAEGLRALAAAGAIRVPRDPVAGRAGGVSFLVMEAVPTGRPKADFFTAFGRRFARLHRETVHEAPAPFGFPHDNYLGSTPQPNGWTAGWVDFFRERRLGHQLRLARESTRTGGLSDAELDRLGDRLLDRLGEWLDLPEEPACLLHGDLWSGNYLSDEAGDPVLIDPAAYYGHREADLAMTELFGGFDSTFYDAYEAEWPLPPGSPERRELYKLYHLLNHLNLFGRGYRGRCAEILRRFAG
jgi:fructosamine-3-kinase